MQEKWPKLEEQEVPELTSSLRPPNHTYLESNYCWDLSEDQRKRVSTAKTGGRASQPTSQGQATYHMSTVAAHHQRRTRAAHTDVTLYHVTLMTRGAFAAGSPQNVSYLRLLLQDWET